MADFYGRAPALDSNYSVLPVQACLEGPSFPNDTIASWFPSNGRTTTGRDDIVSWRADLESDWQAITPGLILISLRFMSDDVHVSSHGVRYLAGENMNAVAHQYHQEQQHRRR